MMISPNQKILSMGLSLIHIFVMGLVTNNTLLIEMGAPYLRIVGISYIFNAASAVYVGMQRSTENPVLGMVVFAASMLLNTFLNYILIFGKFGAPALGITGAALATLTARVVEFLLTWTYALRDHRVPLRLRAMLRPGRMYFNDFLQYSAPVLINESMWGLGTTVMTAIMGHMVISEEILAAYAITVSYTHLDVYKRQVYGLCADGGEVLYRIGTHYFGTLGGVLLGITATLACLKTAIGLITSCAATFVELFPKSLSYRAYAILFCLFSFGIANFGLNRIIDFSLPVLMFLYPLTITLILLCLCGGWFRYDRRIFVAVTIPTALAAFLDFLKALPAGVQAFLHTEALLEPAAGILPFFELGMGWVIPACIGLAVGLALYAMRPKAQL